MDGATGGGTHDAAPLAFNRAIRVWKSGDKTGALALLEQIADGQHGEVDEAYAERVLRKLLNYVCRFDWPETERIARRAIGRFPGAGFGYRYLGEAVMRQGRSDEAVAPLERAIELDPLDENSRLVLTLIRDGEQIQKKTSRRASYWPVRQRQFDHPRQVIERYVLSGHPDKPFIESGTAFMTLGSCFAVNLAQRLEAAGHAVHSEPIGEEINSTYANRFLLDWLEHGPTDGPTQAIDRVYGPERRERLRQALRGSQVLVLTLGVAPCFFEIESGQFVFSTLGSETGRDYLQQKCAMRTTTVAENVANLEAVLDSAQRIAGHELQVVLTVSPVPLGGTTEYASSVIADCLSKSTLRLACEEVLGRRPDAVYWPSFEIVRWLGAHYTATSPPVFGVEDGAARHVSAWLVDLIIQLFIAHHSAREAEHSAPALSAG